jgi:hypothetical protein
MLQLHKLENDPDVITANADANLLFYVKTIIFWLGPGAGSAMEKLEKLKLLVLTYFFTSGEKSEK